MLVDLKDRYTIVIVPHSIQQAARVADNAAFFLGGQCVEYGVGSQLFIAPRDKRTEDYVTGRFG
jgi:phosphate transport system ATP-binding protein